MASSTGTTCPFCEIVRGTAPAEIIRNGENFIAFKDHRPQAKVHIVIAPKKHFTTVRDLPTMGQIAIFTHVLETAQALKLEGYRVVANIGRGGGQRVMHAHVHLIARR